MSMLPERIVCLTEETTETLYLLGEQHRIVGISGFTVRPPIARREKPKVSAFTSARIPRILALEPDLVLAFSDMQADIAAQLVREGVAVHVFNQRSVEEIRRMIALLGAMVGASAAAARLLEDIDAGMQRIRDAAAALPRRPRVYFEEWNDPLISGIRWVSELIGMAGGEDCFDELSRSQGARGRIIADPAEVVRRAPDLIIGSWCGKKFRPDRVRARPGWEAIPAVREGQLHEVKSAEILQPGPAALTDGLAAVHRIIVGWAQR
jgi:iron complex transport system substrate-binding protein